MRIQKFKLETIIGLTVICMGPLASWAVDSDTDNITSEKCIKGF